MCDPATSVIPIVKVRLVYERSVDEGYISPADGGVSAILPTVPRAGQVSSTV